jgi:hypothetical protein
VNGVRKTLAVSFDCLVGRHRRVVESEGFEVWGLSRSSFCIGTFLCDVEAGFRGKVCWDIEPYICVEWLQSYCCVCSCVCAGVCVLLLLLDRPLI